MKSAEKYKNGDDWNVT